MGKILIIAGVILILLGLMIQFGKKTFLPFNLPGDLQFQKGNVKVYLPIATSLLLSVLLSLIFFLIQRFKN